MKSFEEFQHRIFIFSIKEMVRIAVSLLIFIFITGCANPFGRAPSSLTSKDYHPGVSASDVPTAVTSFSVSGVIPSISLTWSGATGGAPLTYTLLRSTTSGSGYSPIATGITGNTYTDATAVSGTAYYYVLQTVNPFGSSANSSELSATPYAAVSYTWPFNAGTDSSYAFNSNSIELVGGVVRLKNQTPGDSSNSSTLGFGAGTSFGLIWDGVNNKLKLDPATSSGEMNSAWTPKYSNLILYSKLNGTIGAITNGLTISSTIGPDGVAQNANGTGMSFFGGAQNQSIFFDGTDDFIEYQGFPFTGNGSFSISAWINTNVTGTRKSIITSGSMGGNAGAWLYVNAANQLQFDLTGAVGPISTATVADGAWHHVAVVNTGGSMQLYVDGAASGVAVAMNPNLINNSTRIGRTLNGYATPYLFAGQIDETAVWNTNLNALEVRKIYERQHAAFTGSIRSRVFDSGASSGWNGLSWLTTLPFGKEIALTNETNTAYSGLAPAPTPNLPNGLVALYRFNEIGSGTAPGGKDLIDFSGNGNHATKTAGTLTFGYPGLFNQSVFFGTHSYLTVPATLNPWSGDFSISTWLKPTDMTLAADHVAFVKEVYSSNGFRLGLGWNNRWTYWTNESGGTVSIGTGSAAPGNTWAHLAVTFVSATHTTAFYVNGQLIGTSTGTFVPPAGGLQIGNGGGWSYDGAMDETGIWSRVLNANEINDLYQRGANRLLLQARTCTAADCSDDPNDANWRGNATNSFSFLKELDNTTAGAPNNTSPNFLFSNFGFSLPNNRYFQYRALLESDASPSSFTPDLVSVSAGAMKFDGSIPVVIPVDGPSYTTLTGFSEILGGAGCSGTPKYQLSRDKITWYYYSGGIWTSTTSGYVNANIASTVNSNISTFPSVAGTGKLYVKVFLPSDTTTACEIDSLAVTGGDVTPTVSSNPQAFQLTSIVDGSTQVTLNWSAAPGATSYTVCYGITFGACTSTFNAGAATTATINGLTNNTAYYFYVLANNASGSTATPGVLSATPLAVPSVPTALVASAGYSHVNLSWTASTGSGAITYSVKRTTTSGAGYTTLASGLTSPAYTDLTALNGTTYYYVITASNAGGTSANSAEASAISIGSFNITGVTTVSGSATLTWSTPPGGFAASYTISYGTSSGIYTTTLTNKSSPTTVNGLTDGTTYYFLLTANNPSGSAHSTSETAVTTIAPFTPTLSMMGGTATITAAPAGATNFTVKYGTTSGSYTTTLTNKTSPVTITGLTVGINYYFQVIGLNSQYGSYTAAEVNGFMFQWPFTSGTTASYTLGAGIDFSSYGVCELTGTQDFTDDDSTATGFGGAVLKGAIWDAVTNEVRLGNNGGCNGTLNDCYNSGSNQLSNTWTPKWANLIAYWPMDNAWTDPVGGHTLVPSAAAAFTAAAKLGTNAADFTASSYATYTPPGGNTTMDIPGKTMTIALWYYPTATPQSYAPFVKKGTAATNNNYDFACFSTTYQMYFTHSNGTAWQDVLSGLYLVPNQWNFIAVSVNGNNYTFMLNGVTTTGTNNQPMVTNTAAVQVNGSAGNTEFGKMDELAIWNTALTTNELLTIYNRQAGNHTGTLTSRVMDSTVANQPWSFLSWFSTLPFGKELPDAACTAPCTHNNSEQTHDYSALVGSTGALNDDNTMSGLVGLYHLNEASGSATVIDDSGWGANGTVIGGAANTFGSTGLFGGAFLGTNSAKIRVVHPNTTAFASGIATVSYWIFCTLQSCLMPFGFGSYDLEFVNNTIGFNTGNSDVYGIASATPYLGKWTHVVAEFHQGDYTLNKLYLNGQAQTLSQQTGTQATFSATLATTYYIGGWGNAGNQVTGALMDEVAIWNRALNSTEVLQLYRRGANRIRFQVRSCTTADAGLTTCTDDPTDLNWKGPDGSSSTWFSEMNNNTAPLDYSGDVNKVFPNMSFPSFTSPPAASRYIQYRTILESTDTGALCNYSGAAACSPELKSVTVGPNRYVTTIPTVVGNTGKTYTSLYGFVEKLGVHGCSAGITYNLGVGASAAAATWYWWDATANAGAGGWVAANGTVAKSNAGSVISSHISVFGAQVGAGTIYFKAYLNSTGTSPCELDNLEIDGKP